MSARASANRRVYPNTIALARPQPSPVPTFWWGGMCAYVHDCTHTRTPLCPVSPCPVVSLSHCPCVSFLECVPRDRSTPSADYFRTLLPLITDKITLAPFMGRAATAGTGTTHGSWGCTQSPDHNSQLAAHCC